eukprot:3840859-Prymnesium_polylepis.1
MAHADPAGWPILYMYSWRLLRRNPGLRQQQEAPPAGTPANAALHPAVELADAGLGVLVRIERRRRGARPWRRGGLLRRAGCGRAPRAWLQK